MDQPRQIRRRYVRQPALAREVRPSARQGPRSRALPSSTATPSAVQRAAAVVSTDGGRQPRASAGSHASADPVLESTGIEWENESTAVPRDENEALTTQ